MVTNQRPLLLKIMILLIFLLSLLPLATTWLSGQFTPQGIPFWGPHGHDSIWHLALISQIATHFPPANPIFSGLSLTNYHYGYDILVAFLTKITPLSLAFVNFRFLPFIFSLAVSFLSYFLALKLTRNKVLAFFFVFLNLFAGSAGYLVEFIRSGNLGGESLFWSMQSVSFLINPPYALSLVLCLLALWLLARPSPVNLFLIGLILGILPIVKIYGFGFLLLILATYVFLEFTSKGFKKMLRFYPLILGAIPLTLAIFIYFGFFRSGSLLTYEPLWFSHSLIEAQDKLFWPQLASWRTNVSASLTILKLPLLVLVEIFLILLFYVGNFFIRILGFSPSNLKNLSPLEKSLLLASGVMALIPLIFIQKGTPWNTIQFLYYSLIGANYFLAKFLSRQVFPVSLALVILASVTSLGTLKDYFGYPSPAILPSSELPALDYLSTLPGQIVFTYPYDPHKKDGLATPIPLRYYETSAYVSAYSGKQTYLSDTMNAAIIGLPYQDRLLQSTAFVNSSDRYAARGFLLANRIDYLYLTPSQNLPLSPQDLEVTLIYDQSGFKIYQVQK